MEAITEVVNNLHPIAGAAVALLLFVGISLAIGGMGIFILNLTAKSRPK